MEYLRVIIIAALVGFHLCVGTPQWLMPGGAPYIVRALSYSFFHASWWHLAVNAIAVCSLYRPGVSCKPCRDLLFPFLIAVLVYPLSFRPVIGFSNILYAVIGLRTPPLSSRWWRQTPVLVFIAVTLAMVFVPRFSATTHIAAFLLGIAGAYAMRFHKSVMKDAGRYL